MTELRAAGVTEREAEDVEEPAVVVDQVGILMLVECLVQLVEVLLQLLLGHLLMPLPRQAQNVDAYTCA